MKAIMKFLVTNIGKTLKVWPEEVFDTHIDERFTIIGGDCEKSVPIDKYIQDFPG
jgi:hypothetical protein